MSPRGCLLKESASSHTNGAAGVHCIARSGHRGRRRRCGAGGASAGAPPTPSAATSPSAPSLPPVRSRTAVRRRHIARAICVTPRAHALAAARRSHSLRWPRPSASCGHPVAHCAADEVCHMLPPLVPLSQRCHYRSCWHPKRQHHHCLGPLHCRPRRRPRHLHSGDRRVAAHRVAASRRPPTHAKHCASWAALSACLHCADVRNANDPAEYRS